MKKTSCLLVISLSMALSFHWENETSSLYIKCIKLHLQSQKKDTINIIKNDFVQLPSNAGNHFIRTIDLANPDFLLSSQSMYVLKILPIQIERSYLTITLNDYLVNVKGNDTSLAYTGGKRYYFKYNCSTGKYTFFKSSDMSF